MVVNAKSFWHFLCRYFHWEMCSWMWSTLAIIYLSYCPINARYYEFTVGMSLVSVTVSSMSNVLSDYRNNLEPGTLTSKYINVPFPHRKWKIPKKFFHIREKCFQEQDFAPEGWLYYSERSEGCNRNPRDGKKSLGLFISDDGKRYFWWFSNAVLEQIDFCPSV